MTNTVNLKQELIKMAEFYEGCAKNMKWRMERATEGSKIQKDIRDCYNYHRGQAQAMRQMLELIEEYNLL